MLLHDFGSKNTASTGCVRWRGQGIVSIRADDVQPRLVVFSDVDGVLSDLHGPAFAEAAETLKPLRLEDIPLVLCSSKHVREIEAIQQELGLKHRFVCESGARSSFLRVTSGSTCRMRKTWAGEAPSRFGGKMASAHDGPAWVWR